MLNFRRLDLQHHLLKLTWGDQLATIDFDKSGGVHRVLDVGTGTGIWAIEWGNSPVSKRKVKTITNSYEKVTNIQTQW